MQCVSKTLQKKKKQENDSRVVFLNNWRGKWREMKNANFYFFKNYFSDIATHYHFV